MFELFAARSTLTLEQAKQVLGVPPSGYMSPEDLKAIYRQKALAAHPDRGGTHTQIQQVNEAYDVLRGKAQPAAPSYDFRDRGPQRPPPRRKPAPPPSGQIKLDQLTEIMTYVRRASMSVFKWKELGLHRIVPYGVNSDSYSHLTEDQANKILSVLRQWQDVPAEPLATREQINEIVRHLRTFDPPLRPASWDQLGLGRIVPYPHHEDVDIRYWTDAQADKVVRILRAAAQEAQARRQEQSRSTEKEPRPTKAQLAKIIAAQLTSDEWYALGFNRIMRYPQTVADYNDLTKDDAFEILAKLKNRKPRAAPQRPRSTSKSNEPTARARERMYEAYDRAVGDHDFKFAKMLVALRKRIKATTDPAKQAGIVDMLREELQDSRWTSAEKVVLRQILEAEL
jgi:hypothetical protein